jgi:hypothetical protein
VEGAVCAVPGVCAPGGRFGWECGASLQLFLLLLRTSRAESTDWEWKQTVMVLKYLIKEYPLQTLYFGIANVVANGLVMLRFVDVFPAAIHPSRLLTSLLQYYCSMDLAEHRG